MKEFGRYTHRRHEKAEAVIFETSGKGDSMMVYFWDHYGIPNVLKKADFDKQYISIAETAVETATSAT